MVPSTIYCSNCGTQNQTSNVYCFACGTRLRKLTVSAIATTVPSSTPTPIEPVPMPFSSTGMLPPHTLLKQRYLVLQSVARGGMGAVYMAQDTSLGNRLVAVKEMSQGNLPRQEGQSAVENFMREAHLLAGLHHPNLPSIHDHFEDAARWYLVMDFVQGETLEEYLLHSPGQKLPLEEVLQIGQQLCDVLDYLHTCQPPIIFRDLKPANIMRTPKGHIYLIDFGIARHFKPGQHKDTASYGSPGYSPPEQYGQAQTSERSDIYSLGATLYHLLSGYKPTRSPFRLPPLQSLVPTLPPRLITLITQMVDLDDSRRPVSIKVVQQELQQCATSLSMSPLPVTPIPGPLQSPTIPTPTSDGVPPAQISPNRGIFSMIGVIMGILLALLGSACVIVGLVLRFSIRDINLAGDHNLTGGLVFANGETILFFGLMIFFIARLKKSSDPISNFSIAKAIVEIFVGCFAIISGILVFAIFGELWISYGSYLYPPIIITFIEGITIMCIAWFTHLKK